MSLARQVALLALVVVVVTAVAELAGAANFGTAISFAQMAFAVAVTALILRR